MFFVIWLACSAGDTDSGSADTSMEYLTTDITQNGLFTVSYTTDPSPIPADDYFSVTATVYAGDDTSTPLLDAVVDMDAGMPSHGHGMNVSPETTDNGDGTHTGSPFLFHMSGNWLMSFAVEHDGQTDIAEMNVRCCE